MKNALSLACMLLVGILLSTSGFAQSNTLFNPDYNGDGFIGVDYILGALSFYDNAWDGPVANVIYGCTYPLFVEYDASANVDDGSCLNLAQNCGFNLTYQGYDYATVLIGEQCWFAENLRSENYENGDAIPAGLSDSDWQNTNSGAVAVYGEDAGCENYSPDIDACDPTQSLNEYGRLYNWYAVDDARGLCPSGWHVPTDFDWTCLTHHLGGESIAVAPMKTDYGWFSGGNGTNSSGFSGLPGGNRDSNGDFDFAGHDGVWWSSSPYGSPYDATAWDRVLSYFYEVVFRTNNDLRYGFSVRCVRDAE